jgi:hypothetical protein
MNPKTVNDLDPKLKETYERVMGTSLAGNPSTPPPTMETQPISQPEPKIELQPETPTPSPDESSTVAQVFRADESNKSIETTTVNPPSKNETAAKTGGKKLLPIVIVGAVVFFAIYAVIWAKLLGLF